MDLVRATLRTDDLPLVIGKISDSLDGGDIVFPYGDLVQQAQETYAKTETNVAIVRSTRFYTFSDRWHYNSEAYIDLGNRFASVLQKVIINQR